MTVLVLGGSGFLGRAIARGLLDAGETVTTVSRTPVERLGERHEHHRASLDDVRVLPQLLAETARVIHAAGDTTPGSSATQPAAELEYNLLPLGRLLNWLIEAGSPPLLYVSSGGAIYDPASRAEQFTEEAPKKAQSYYSAAKLAAEHFVEAYHSAGGGAATIVRPANVYGPGQAGKKQFGIVPTLCNALLRGLEFPLWGDGSATRDYLYIDDFVALCVAALREQDAPAQLRRYNAGSGTGATVLELCRLLEAVSGRTLAMDHRPPRHVDVARAVLDSRHAMRQLGWQPRTDLRAGLTATWQWYRAAHGGS